MSAEVDIIKADLAAADPAVLRSAMQGADAVLSWLRRRSASDAGIASRGTRAIVEAMEATNVRRLVVVSAAPISTVLPPAVPTYRGTILGKASSPAICSLRPSRPSSARAMPTWR